MPNKSQERRYLFDLNRASSLFYKRGKSEKKLYVFQSFFAIAVDLIRGVLKNRLWRNCVLSILTVSTYFVSSQVMAQSWSGTVGGIKVEIAGRDDQGQGRSFIIYIGQDIQKPLILRNCGSVRTGKGIVLFCSDDLNKYDGPGKAISIANYYNLRFSHGGREYACVATTQKSPLFCRIKVKQESTFNDEEFKLDNLIRYR